MTELPPKAEENSKKELEEFPKIPFLCGRCGLSETVDYQGDKPPFCRTKGTRRGAKEVILTKLKMKIT